MNRVCAYCGAPALGRSMVTARRKRGPSDALKWSICAAAVVFPIVGIIPGLAYAQDRDRAHRAAARLWLFVGLCSTFIYLVLFLI